MFGGVHKDCVKRRTEGEWLVYRSLLVIYVRRIDASWIVFVLGGA
jgi:hypothetical protein